MNSAELMQDWIDRVADYKGSGLTKVQWCEKTGFSTRQLKYWVTKVNRLGRTSESAGWAQLEVADSGSGLSSGISIRVGIARIEVEPGFDKAVLGEVMRVVASIC